MIKEDYVSFEIAKLLKEKGFKEKTVPFYEEDTKFCSRVGNVYQPFNWNYDKRFTYYSAPTLQMTMKWLREKHNLVIEPYRTACGYLYTISNIPYGSTKYDNSRAFDGDDEDSGQWSTWEKACEDGIKYCLKNLI